MAGRFSVEAVFKAVDRVTRPVSRMQNRVGKFTRTMTRNFNKLNRSVNKFGRGMKTAGRNVAIGLAIAAAGMVNVLAAGADFEQAITDVGAVSLKTREQIAPLEQLALKLGKTTKFTATQAAQAMEVMARAGFKSQEILKATPAVLSAAAASGLEIAEVANHVSNVLKGMALDTSEAAKVADVLALASARTNSTIGSLGESMKNVASTARQLNVPLEDTVAAVALLQDVGLDASVAGSAFNVMLTKMAAPSAKIQKIMKSLNISFKDANGNMKSLPAVIKDINTASKKMGGNFDQVAFLAELVGLRGQKAAANLSQLFETGKLAELTKELKNAEGAANRMANIRMNTVKGSLLLLGSAVDAVKVKIFDMNKGPLKDTIDSFTAWVGANEDLIATKVGGFIGKLIDNLGNIAKWIKRIAIGLAVFITFSAILKTLVGVLTLVNLVMAANPITLIILGVVALIAAIAVLVSWWDEIKAAFMESPTWIKAVVGVLALLSGPIGWFIAAAVLIMENWEPIKQFFIDLWGATADAFVNAKNRIVATIEGIKAVVSFLFNSLPGPVQDAITGMLAPIKALLSVPGLIIDNWEPIKGFFADLWNGVVNIFNGAIDRITGVIDKVKDVIGVIKDVFTGGGEIDVHTPKLPTTEAIQPDTVASVFNDAFNKSIGTQPRPNVVPKIISDADSANDAFIPTDSAQARPQIVSPQDRLARSIEERRESSSAEVTLRDETGRAEVTDGKLGNGIKLQSSGGF